MDRPVTDTSTDQPTEKPPKAKPTKEHMHALAAKAVQARKAKASKSKQTLEDIGKVSLSKHKDRLLNRAVFLADEIYRQITDILDSGEADKHTGKLRDLMWNYGVLHDKVVAKSPDSTGPIRLPPRLLEAVTAVIERQLVVTAPQAVPSEIGACTQQINRENQ